MKNKSLKRPFFAAFLENQMKNTEKVKGGKSSITLPSRDNVTLPSRDNIQTMKYPSDNDEGGDTM